MAEENQIGTPFKNNENGNDNNIDTNQVNQEPKNEQDLTQKNRRIGCYFLSFIFIVEIVLECLSLFTYDDDKESNPDSDNPSYGGLSNVILPCVFIPGSLIMMCCIYINCSLSVKIAIFIILCIADIIFSIISLVNTSSQSRGFNIGAVVCNALFMIFSLCQLKKIENNN